MSKRVRRVDFIKSELKKSRAVALVAVQIFNNPNISFKSESYVDDNYRLDLSSQRLFLRSKNQVSVLKQNGKRWERDKTKHEVIRRACKLFLLNNISNVTVQKNV